MTWGCHHADICAAIIKLCNQCIRRPQESIIIDSLACPFIHEGMIVEVVIDGRMTPEVEVSNGLRHAGIIY